MRITIGLSADKGIELPIHYNYILQGFLYRNISDKDYRTFLHKTGYRLAKRQFKLFTFSRLLGRFNINQREGKITFYPPVELVVSSAVEQFITDLAETLIRTDFIFLGSQRVEVHSIQVHKESPLADKVQVKMLSPVVAYSTIYNDKKKYTEYYSPWNPEFQEIFANNLLAKHEILYGQRPKDQEIKIIPNGNQEKKFARIINYKGTYIRAYAGIYWLIGNPDLIRIAYDAGLGSKNSQGFGCMEVV